MKRVMFVVLIFVSLILISCSSSHSSNDSDSVPDSDTDMQDSEIVDGDSDLQDSEIVDDSDDDSDSPEPAEEIFEETEPINGYERCYDKIPAGPYDGFFADPKLESQIKQILGYEADYELKEEDLEKITEINLSVKDLRGIEKLVNLEYAKFNDKGGGGNIYDFTPLSNLKKLKKVRIYFRRPVEISPDEHVVNMTCLDGSFSLLMTLETLEIEETQLKDISPIEQLVNLKTLDLGINQIEFLPENLGNLQKLEFLSFVHNRVKDVTPLKSLTNLKELFFHYNYVEDISPIKDLVGLTRLGCDGNNIKDISAITNLVNLTQLLSDQNRIEKIPEGIENLKKLQEIQLEFNKISSLPPLNGLESIKKLDLSHNELEDKDLFQLDGLKNLEFLYVAVNKKITKVPIMKDLKSLKELYLNYNSITDLSGFADNESFPALRRLDVGSNNIDNVEAFRNRKGLSSLWVDKNCIKDFSPLEELKARGTYVGGMNEQLESCEDTTTLGEGE
ncbi:leucine-rich repeat domain-containing protein [bacterium]|nr:leucine-rich repeat domain-containing protein [bacterium]